MEREKSIKERLQAHKDTLDAKAQQAALEEAERLAYIKDVETQRDEFIERVIKPIFAEFCEVLNAPEIKTVVVPFENDGGYYTLLISLWFVDARSNRSDDTSLPRNHVVAVAYRRTAAKQVHIFAGTGPGTPPREPRQVRSETWKKIGELDMRETSDAARALIEKALVRLLPGVLTVTI